MKEIKWNEAYSVGSEILDEHHQKLFEYIRLLESEEYRDITSEEFLLEIIKKLEDYTGYHFDEEEEIMKKHDYPYIEEHMAEHKEFKHNIDIFKRSFDKDRPKLVNHMAHYLKTWLISHVLGTDKKYSTYFASKGIKVE